MRGATEYLGSDIYVEDEETVTRIFYEVEGQKVIFTLTPQEAQRLYEILAKSRQKEG